jgi:hypothetical protein
MRSPKGLGHGLQGRRHDRRRKQHDGRQRLDAGVDSMKQFRPKFTDKIKITKYKFIFF